ncbi:uroporphyrinogen decarboxylase [Alienimonas sp. DA493]|uniref:uroporphyrinogen decarboxylase n=1 Tax=Alienimonas sp. DA493 TaxID=3373605 RepID=UPI003754FF79
MPAPDKMPAADSAAPDPLRNSLLMRALRREPVERTPVWLMRQAGRYLPEYAAVRRGYAFEEFCKRPDLSAQVTLDAQAILGVDAAILFADLPTILEPLGFSLTYDPGPVIGNPARTAADVDAVREVEDTSELGFVYETVRAVRAQLPADVPLLGFGGCPFTLASYAIEGGSSRHYEHTKRLMYGDPDRWHTFMGKIGRAVAEHLRRQFAEGVQAVQIFDSWAGALSPGDYRRYVLPHTKALVEAVRPHGPVINFLTGNPALLPALAECGAECVGLDWRVDLADGWATVGHDVAVQGNLDPTALYAPFPELKRQTAAVLDAAGGRPGHIFNLGHGLLPTHDAAAVKGLVKLVADLSAR